MPYISKSTIDKVYSAIEGKAADIIGEFVELKKNGANYKGYSPFNKEKTPSFIVSPAKGIFKDFSSGTGGTPISFLMEYKGYSYPETIEYLAKKYNVIIEYDKDLTPEKQEKYKKINDAIKIISEINSLFQQNLKEDTAAYKYLVNERGLLPQTISDFRVGYHPRDYNLKYTLKEFDLKSPVLVSDLGLLYVDENKKYAHSLKHRITIPYLNHRDECTGFTARTLYTPEEIRFIEKKYETSIAKWKNSKQSDLFDKSKQIFGINLAKNEIRKQGFAYLVEGAFDVMMVYQLGKHNVIAANGTALTDDHIVELSRYTSTIVLMYDGDQLGYDDKRNEKALIRNAKKLIQAGFNVKVKLLPEDMDPGDYFSPLFYYITGIPVFSFPVIERSRWQSQYMHYPIIRKETHPVQRFNDIPDIDFLDYYIPFLKENTIRNKEAKAESLSSLAFILAKENYDKIRTLFVKEILTVFDINKTEWNEFFLDIHKAEKDNQREKAKFSKNLVKEQQQLIPIQTKENKERHDFYFLSFDAHGEFRDIEFDDVKFLKLLKNRSRGFGFFRYTIEIGKHVLVYIKDNKLKIVDEVFIMDIFRKYIIDLKPYEYNYHTNDDQRRSVVVGSDIILNKMLKKKNYLFDMKMLYQLEPDIPILIKEDDQDAKYFYRSNGFVKITRDDISLHPYSELDGFVWEDMVVDREYKPVEEKKTGVAEQFIMNIANNDNDRFYAIRTIIGYLLHFYFKTMLVEIVFTDAALTKDTKSNGQSGKDLLNDLLGYTINKDESCKSYVSIDGTQIKKSDKNKYSEIEINTKFITFSDVYPNFDLRDHFVQIRKGWQAQKMYQDANRIITKTSLSTNKTLKMDGPSYYNRVVPVELWNYYSDKLSPEDEFGHRFMDDWDKPEYREQAYLWDHFVFESCRLYFRNNCRIKRPKLINLQRRELYDHTNPDFVAWMDFLCNGDLENDQDPFFKYYHRDDPESRYLKKDLYDKFTQENSHIEVKQRTFTNWIAKYFENEDIKYEIKVYAGQGFYAINNGLLRNCYLDINKNVESEQPKIMDDIPF